MKSKRAIADTLNKLQIPAPSVEYPASEDIPVPVQGCNPSQETTLVEPKLCIDHGAQRDR